jgi:hypothetical protein
LSLLVDVPLISLISSPPANGASGISPRIAKWKAGGVGGYPFC